MDCLLDVRRVYLQPSGNWATHYNSCSMAWALRKYPVVLGQHWPVNAPPTNLIFPTYMAHGHTSS